MPKSELVQSKSKHQQPKCKGACESNPKSNLPKPTSAQPRSKANARATNPKEMLSDANAMMAQPNRQLHNTRHPRLIPAIKVFFLFHYRHHKPSHCVKLAFLQWVLSRVLRFGSLFLSKFGGRFSEFVYFCKFGVFRSVLSEYAEF